MRDTRPVMIEIAFEENDRKSVKSFYAYAVPAVGECIQWASKYKVEVLDRDWVLDAEYNPSGDLRCVLVCKKLVWPKK